MARWRGSAEAFGIGVAILIGDLLQAWTDELLHGSGLPVAALVHGRPVLDAMRTEVIAGQYLDLLSQAAGDGTVDSALRVVRYKSAKYTIERPLHLGVALASAAAASAAPGSAAAGAPGSAAAGAPGSAAAVAPGSAAGSTDPGAPGSAASVGNQAAPLGANEQAIGRVCTDYGIPLGIAFQLRDDVLGLFGDPAETGKPVSGDLREGKRTVLVAMARRRANAAQAGILDRHLGNPHVDEAGAAAVRAVISETGALAECEAMIDRDVADALGAIDGAPIAEAAKDALADLAHAATARSE